MTLRNALSVALPLVVAALCSQGCSAEVEAEAAGDDPPVADAPDESAEALSGGELACAVSKAASGAALVGAVACWVTTPASGGTHAPVCVWLSSAGVTAAKLANSAAQCATGCGLAGAACENIAQSFARRATTTARIANVGCNARGQFASEADVCGLGMNRIYDVNAPESRACVVGKPTGFWALSSTERAYLRDPRNCAARGVR
jgi:hypothetical protein